MGKNQKIKNCKSCEKELDKSAKICPSCGKDQRSFFGKHKILTGILILALFGFIGALNSEAEEDKAADVKVTAEELARAYEENEAKAQETYGDKRVQITGKIDSILENTIVVEVEDNEMFDLNYVGVFCSFSREDEQKKLSGLKKGQEITITGTCAGGDIAGVNVDLNNCVIND